jgi:CDP-diacylglycerol--serine O-phosphatidyltransferase
VAFVLTVYAGIAMVSNAPFYSGKSFALGRSVPFWVMLLLVAVFVFVSSDPPVVLFGPFVVYGLSGWVILYWRWRRARKLNQLRHENASSPSETPVSTGASAAAGPHTYGSAPSSMPEGADRSKDTASPAKEPFIK